MRHIPFSIALILAGFLSFGCEEIVDDPGALPYEEKLVVRGVLEAGEPLDSISITRTLPPLEYYSDEKAWVHGALVVLHHNGRTDTLQDRGRGLYYKPGIAVEAGDVYELTVQWNNKRAEAVTRVPHPPVVTSVDHRLEKNRWGTNVHILEATVQPRTGEVYGSTFEYRYSNIPTYVSRYPYLDVLRTAQDTSAAGVVTVYSEFYAYGSDLYEFFLLVHAYDEPYYHYHYSYRGDNDDPFGQPGQNIQWNVRGDAIGMFIGMATSPRIAL